MLAEIAFSSVCRRWKTLAIHSPRLWTKVYVTPRLATNPQLHLSRSRELPLELIIEGRPWAGTILTLSMNSTRPPPSTADISLSLSGTTPFLPFMGMEMPNLKHCQLMHWADTEDACYEFLHFLKGVPGLNSLRLEGPLPAHPRNTSPIKFPSLQELVIVLDGGFICLRPLFPTIKALDLRRFELVLPEDENHVGIAPVASLCDATDAPRFPLVDSHSPSQRKCLFPIKTRWSSTMVSEQELPLESGSSYGLVFVISQSCHPQPKRTRS
ncbi:hypothetical protein BS17DRAFT_878600 [Gyrodon lividus]|nr:hypothetical protein BS17DRAFT_878600 [Gyrodon lividus]